MRHIFHRTILGALLLAGLPLWALSACQFPSRQPGPGISFNDRASQVMTLENEFYEIRFDKNNGAILAITDRKTGQQVSDGNLHGQLWKLSLLYSSEDLHAAQYSPQGEAAFTYTWSKNDQRLTFLYTPGAQSKKKLPVTVTITPSPGAYFDLQITVENNSTYPTREIRFPGDLLFSRAAVSAALLPIMPGIVLGPQFFRDVSRYETLYPGYPGVFADFMALESKRGLFALYASSAGGPVIPTALGFYSDSCAAESTCYIHAFRNRVPAGGKWTSPVVRVSVSSGWDETIERFRVDDGIANLPGLEQKLGERYQSMATAPLYKADASQLAIPFSDYPALLARVPYPGLLHPVGYGPRGFDRTYPDFIPPAPQWGTTAQMAEMARQAQSRGFLVMLYTNPTWWDEESPTLQKRPADVRLASIVAQDDQGQQYEECYGCPENPHYGVVVSPYAAFVQARLAQLNRQAAGEVPGDLLFEDQIGARAPVYDYNPASPAPDAYMQGWVDHTRAFSAARLMTELGFDRLLESEVGFHGSALLPQRLGYTTAWWGSDWKYYPFVTRLARDKAVFYQHDLAPETFTYDAATLAWNLAMGYSLSYDLVPSSFGGGPDSPWIRVVGAFQAEVLARYAAERVLAYTSLEGGATRTDFAGFSVITNWDAANPLVHESMTLAPSGVLVLAKDESLVAGVFQRFNGAPLSPGDHYLIVQNGPSEIRIMQPAGSDTSVSLKIPASWQSGAALEARAYAHDGSLLGAQPVDLAGDLARFEYRQELDGAAVEYYVISSLAQ